MWSFVLLRHFREISLELRLSFRARDGQGRVSGSKNVLTRLRGILFYLILQIWIHNSYVEIEKRINSATERSIEIIGNLRVYPFLLKLFLVFALSSFHNTGCFAWHGHVTSTGRTPFQHWCSMLKRHLLLHKSWSCKQGLTKQMFHSEPSLETVCTSTSS
jgi:hypothetical protein